MQQLEHSRLRLVYVANAPFFAPNCARYSGHGGIHRNLRLTNVVRVAESLPHNAELIGSFVETKRRKIVQWKPRIFAAVTVVERFVSII